MRVRSRCRSTTRSTDKGWGGSGYRTHPLRVWTGPTLWLDNDSIINGVANPLLAAKVSLSRLHRDVSKQKLNLVKFTAGLMAEPDASSPEIVGCKFVDAGLSRILPNDMPNDFLSQAASPNGACSRHTPEDLSARDSGGVQPIIYQTFDPIWHRNGPNM